MGAKSGKRRKSIRKRALRGKLQEAHVEEAQTLRWARLLRTFRRGRKSKQREQALWELWAASYPGLLDVLREALGGRSYALRRSAVRLAGRLGRAALPLRAELQRMEREQYALWDWHKGEPKILWELRETLYWIPLDVPTAREERLSRVQLLERLARAKRANDRRDAALALGGLQDEEVAAALVEALDDKAVSVRRAAIRAVGEMGAWGQFAMGKLLQMASSATAGVLRDICEALDKIAATEHCHSVLRWADEGGSIPSFVGGSGAGENGGREDCSRAQGIREACDGRARMQEASRSRLRELREGGSARAKGVQEAFRSRLRELREGYAQAQDPGGRLRHSLQAREVGLALWASLQEEAAGLPRDGVRDFVCALVEQAFVRVQVCLEGSEVLDWVREVLALVRSSPATQIWKQQQQAGVQRSRGLDEAWLGARRFLTDVLGEDGAPVAAMGLVPLGRRQEGFCVSLTQSELFTRDGRWAWKNAWLWRDADKDAPCPMCRSCRRHRCKVGAQHTLLLRFFLRHAVCGLLAQDVWQGMRLATWACAMVGALARVLQPVGGDAATFWLDWAEENARQEEVLLTCLAACAARQETLLRWYETPLFCAF